MAQVQGSPPWSDLLPELLGLVFLRLPTCADRGSFRAVCRAWCTAARHCRLPPPSPVPWLLLPDGSATSFPRGETFQLPDGVQHHCSCGEWLFLSRRDDGSCFLMDHFTKATIQLPSLSSYSFYHEPVEVDDDMIDEDPDTWMDHNCITEKSVLSIAVCSTRLVAAVIAVGNITSTIALCRPGAAAWSVSAHQQLFLSSMVLFQGKLYALEKNIDFEDLIAIDIVDERDSDQPRVSRIQRLIEGDYLGPAVRSSYVHYLVESHGTLLMIHRKRRYKGRVIVVDDRNEFEVFEADFEQCMWAEVKTLGNSQALFLGQRYSRAVHISPYDLSRDRIFFVDDCPNRHLLPKQTTESCGVYDMKDEKVYSPLASKVSWERGNVPATWIFSQGGTDKLQTEVQD